jgi:hypothetical protein
MPTEISAPRINSNMVPSQPVAGVEIEAARGEEADADHDENQVQHLRSPKGPSHSRRGFGAVLLKHSATLDLRVWN